MFYKVIYNDKVIDVLDRLAYLKYQGKHDRMIFCKEDEAQAILSSDGNDIWHVDGLYDIPVDKYETVKLVEIDKYEYRQQKAFNGKTPEDIVDEFVLLTLNNETEILKDSLKRLYDNGKIEKAKVIKLCENGYITDEQMRCALGN